MHPSRSTNQLQGIFLFAAHNPFVMLSSICEPPRFDNPTKSRVGYSPAVVPGELS